VDDGDDLGVLGSDGLEVIEHVSEALVDRRRVAVVEMVDDLLFAVVGRCGGGTGRERENDTCGGGDSRRPENEVFQHWLTLPCDDCFIQAEAKPLRRFIPPRPELTPGRVERQASCQTGRP
jgi:hypothetical protein